jgi:hypothetical protein
MPAAKKSHSVWCMAIFLPPSDCRSVAGLGMPTMHHFLLSFKCDCIERGNVNVCVRPSANPILGRCVANPLQIRRPKGEREKVCDADAAQCPITCDLVNDWAAGRQAGRQPASVLTYLTRWRKIDGLAGRSDGRGSNSGT